MSIFDGLFQKRRAMTEYNQVFQVIPAYEPVFTSWRGGLYESLLCRAAIDARARHVQKLNVKVIGSDFHPLRARLKKGPNDVQTWSQFLYNVSTILDVENTCYIVPIYEAGRITGYSPARKNDSEILVSKGKEYLRFTDIHGIRKVESMDRIGTLLKYEYKKRQGESNLPLSSTMELVNIQNQGIREGVKNSASFRFMARMTNFAKPEDLKKERERFTNDNLSADASGLLLFPNTYGDIKQIESKPFLVDSDQMKLIEKNVYDYFGVNDKILQNCASPEELDAFYNGCIESFAIQLGEVLTRISFSETEIAHGDQIFVSSNRLQYMSTTDKINLVRQLGDRGFITVNEVRELFNYAPLPDDVGSLRPARGEYYYVDDEGNIVKKEDTEDADDTE